MSLTDIIFNTTGRTQYRIVNSNIVSEELSPPGKKLALESKIKPNPDEKAIAALVTIDQMAKYSPALFSPLFKVSISIISAWIEAGIPRSAPTAAPARKQITKNGKKSPLPRKITNKNMMEAYIILKHQSFGLLKRLLRKIQTGEAATAEIK